MAPARPDSVSADSHATPTAASDGVVARCGIYAGRSLLPLTALVIIGGTLVWGPWVSLVLAYVAWRLAGVYA